ncbi:MAG TPA: polysaccharide deacetylase family protein [Gemmatimonadaceae bacterium]|nr:polysaccharide deacetylase family protein [Gemmatimonadaceae bacterium]
MSRVALKVDCDTFTGTRDGIPKLLRAFDRAAVRATFFFTLGPDRSGRAIVRVLTRKGFLRKMLRSRALSLYGPRTALSGTLLPAPHIGRRLGDLIRSVRDAGHEVGVHGWDHVRWHDRLHRMSREAIAHDYGAAHDEFARIFGERARASAAPGWHATAASKLVQEDFHLHYASDTRGGSPFLPAVDGRTLGTLEIPTTLATWDELLGTPACPTVAHLVDCTRRAVTGTEVHSIHTEGEGTVLLAQFEQLLRAWAADGVRIMTLAEVARERMRDPARVPVRRLVRTTLPGRAGEVTGSVAP